MRRYLAEFLSDARVVQLPRWIWLPVLHTIVLRTRPAASAKRYSAVWTAEGSPLAVHTKRQANLLREILGKKETAVEYAMRYGEPTIADGLKKLSACKKISILPLYPQYSRSTTESVRDCLAPGAAMIESFHDHPAYIAALAAGVQRHWSSHGRGEMLIMSFHGLPRRAVALGDPYERQCRQTAQRLAASLRLEEKDWMLTFQSRFGAAEWLQPYTAPTLVELAQRGTRRVQVVCPGFVSDCLETLEEIGIEGRKAFLEAGGSELHVLPCLNESREWILALAEISEIAS